MLVYKNGKVIYLIGVVVFIEFVEDNLVMIIYIKYEFKLCLLEYMIFRKFEWME